MVFLYRASIMLQERSTFYSPCDTFAKSICLKFLKNNIPNTSPLSSKTRLSINNLLWRQSVHGLNNLNAFLHFIVYPFGTRANKLT